MKACLSPGTGGVVSGEPATGNGLMPPTAPLPSNLPRRRRRPTCQSEGPYQRAYTMTHWLFGAAYRHWRNGCGS